MAPSTAMETATYKNALLDTEERYRMALDVIKEMAEEIVRLQSRCGALERTVILMYHHALPL